MAVPAGITESSMAKIAPYNNIACAITNERAIDMKAFHKNILKKERWVDIHKFVSKDKCELSDGLFKIFGNYSDEPPHTVHDNLLGWIYDNFRKLETWLSIVLKQKGVSLSDWVESMRNPKQPSDELYLYLLCRMYHKDTLINLKHHWWSTIQHALPGDLNEILEQCHLELVFVCQWVLDEVKQIRKPLSTRVPSPKPLGIMDSSMTVKNTDETLDQPTVSMTTAQTKIPVVIIENASVINSLPMKECNVHIERLPTTMAIPAVVTEISHDKDLVLGIPYLTPRYSPWAHPTPPSERTWDQGPERNLGPDISPERT